MRTPSTVALTCAAAGLLLVAVPGQVANPSASPPGPFADQPLVFEPNRGQFEAEARYAARSAGYDVFVTGDAVVVSLPAAGGCRARLDLRLDGGDFSRAVQPLKRARSVSKYFLGGDEADWLLDVPHYTRLRCPQVYPGIDLVLYGQGRHLEFDFDIAPGADPAQIRLRYEGARSLEVDARGDLVLDVAGEELIQRAPVVYQLRDGQRVPVRGRYSVRGRGEVAFSLDAYDRRLPVTIDPVLVYSTYLGGSSREDAVDIDVDDQGNAYVTGLTQSADFPTLGTQHGSSTSQVYVAKLDPHGQLVWSTYLGTGRGNLVHAIAVDDRGVFIVGETQGSMPATASAAQPIQGGGADGFLCMIGHPSSTTPFYCTFIGGSGNDQMFGVALPEIGRSIHGSAYVTGYSTSGDFPTTAGAIASTTPGIAIARIDVHSPLSMGAVLNIGNGYGLDLTHVPSAPLNDLVIVGYTRSTVVTGPTLGGVSAGGPQTGFVCRVLGGGQSVVWSAVLGGSSWDQPQAVEIDASENVYIAGWTQSPNYPLVAAIDSQISSKEAFVTKVDSTGRNLLFSTFLGGFSDDAAADLDRDRDGNLYIAGDTVGGVPLVNPLMATSWGQRDGFVTSLTADGQQVRFSTLFGGSGVDLCTGVAVTPDGDVYVTGKATKELPLRNAHQPQNNGGWDAFVTRFTRHSMTAYGPSSPGISGAAPNLAGGFEPRIGQTVSFQIRGGRGGDLGALLIGVGRANLPVLNGTILINPPLHTFVTFQLQGLAGFVPYGFHSLDVFIPNSAGIVGAQLNWQAVFGDVRSLAMTNGVEFFVLP